MEFGKLRRDNFRNIRCLENTCRSCTANPIIFVGFDRTYKGLRQKVKPLISFGTLSTILVLKGALNPNFVNLTINREKFCSRNVLVLFLNLLLLKSCKRILLLHSFQSPLRNAESSLSFKNQILQLDF